MVDPSRVEQVCDAVVRRFGSASEATRAIFVPGRIEVLGKHTDYGGGRSLLAATRQGLCVAFRPRDDARFRALDLTRGMEAEFTISADLGPGERWENYLRTVARRLASNFPGGLRGAEVALTSDLPRAAGMSSSSALVVATFKVLASVNDLESRAEYKAAIASQEDLGGYLGAMENGLDFGSLAGEAGVGTFGGSEDQTAILCSRAGELRQYSYCPVRLETVVDFPEEIEFAIAVSGVRASKTGTAKDSYNRASRLASGAAAAWRAATGAEEPNLAAILASGARPEEIETVLLGTRFEEFSGAELTRRFRHFALESEQLVPAASEALAERDLDAFGRVVDRSQRAVEELLDNQVPETVFLARAAREHGALAASAFGAGFGGSVWALVPRDRMADFLDAWEAGYAVCFPAQLAARFLSTPAAAGAREVSPG